MKVQITRTMTVANDKGEAETFEPTGEGFREDISVSTYQRLNRAGAAVIHSEDEGVAEKHPNMTTDAETATATDSTNGIYSPVSEEAGKLAAEKNEAEGKDDAESEGNDEAEDDAEGDVEDDAKPSDAKLASMTKAELEAFAAKNGYEIDPSKKKDDIISDLKAQFPA